MESGNFMPGFTRSRGGFTLVEVMVAVAIAGLVITGGFKLVTVSLRTLLEVNLEHELINKAQKVYLDYMTREDMADRGEEDGVKWETEADSVIVSESMELKFRRLTVEYGGRRMVFFLPSAESDI